MIDALIDAMKGRPKGRPFRVFLEYFERDSLALQHCNDPIMPLAFSFRVLCEAEKGDLQAEREYPRNLGRAALQQSGHKAGRDHGIDRAIPTKAHNRETVWHVWHRVNDR